MEPHIYPLGCSFTRVQFLKHIHHHIHTLISAFQGAAVTPLHLWGHAKGFSWCYNGLNEEEGAVDYCCLSKGHFFPLCWRQNHCLVLQDKTGLIMTGAERREFCSALSVRGIEKRVSEGISLQIDQLIEPHHFNSQDKFILWEEPYVHINVLCTAAAKKCRQEIEYNSICVANQIKKCRRISYKCISLGTESAEWIL